MRLLLGLVVILATAGVARAQQADSEEPPSPPSLHARDTGLHGFIGGGIGVAADQFIDGAFVLEGGVQLPNTPLYLRGMASTGGAIDFEGGGDYLRGLVGLEARACNASRGVCPFIGFDVGYQRQTWSDGEPEDLEHHHGPILGPSLGLDTGGEHLRFRIALELREYHHTAEYMNLADRTRWDFAPGLAMTVAYGL